MSPGRLFGPRGVALVTSLFVAIILFVLCAAAARQAQENARLLGWEAEKTRRYFLAKAGVNAAIAALEQDLSRQADYAPESPYEERFGEVLVRTWVEPDPTRSTLLHVHSQALVAGQGEPQHFTRVLRLAPVPMPTLLAKAPGQPLLYSWTDQGLPSGMKTGPKAWAGWSAMPALSAPAPMKTKVNGIWSIQLAGQGLQGDGAFSSFCADQNTGMAYALCVPDPADGSWPALVRCPIPERGQTGAVSGWEVVAPLPGEHYPSDSSNEEPQPFASYGPLGAAGGQVFLASSGGLFQLGDNDTSQKTWGRARDSSGNSVGQGVSQLAPVCLDQGGGSECSVYVSQGSTGWSKLQVANSVEKESAGIPWLSDSNCWEPDPHNPGGLVLGSGQPSTDTLSVGGNGDMVAVWHRQGVDSILYVTGGQGELLPPISNVLYSEDGGQPTYPGGFVQHIDQAFSDVTGQPIVEYQASNGMEMVWTPGITPLPLPKGYQLVASGGKKNSTSSIRVQPAGSL